LTIPFFKMHGAGNDFVVIDHREPFLPERAEALFARLCDRRRGIGADGVLLLERDPECDFAMRYWNADGRPADYCGNGARCLARLALDLGLGRGDPRRVRFRTAAGLQSAIALENGAVEVQVGRVAGAEPPCEVEACGRRFTGRLSSPGVPHFVTEVARLEEVPIGEWGAALRHHPRFGAAGANVDFVASRGERTIGMRTYERGVEGETLACGSGAIASALWAAGEGSGSPVRVETAGGDVLTVALRPLGEGWEVSLAGPTEVVYRGEWSESARWKAAGAAAR
jgi:diaminopimelate epimerase